MRRWLSGVAVGLVAGIALAAVPFAWGADSGGTCYIDGVQYDLVRSDTTPTQEGPDATETPAPSMTPTPTATPTEQPRCWGVVVDGPLNVRDAIWVQRIGVADDGQMLALLAYGFDSAGDRWYRVWWEPDEVYGWVHGDYIEQGTGSDCSQLIDETAGAWVPPDNDAGLHLLYSARWDTVGPLVAAGEIGNLKGTDGAEPIIRAARELEPDLLTSWRNLSRIIYGTRDCPPTWGQGDPSHAADQWWSAEYATWQARNLLDVVDYFEYRNECVFVGAWEVAFDLRMLELATNAGVCLAVFSDGYGNPQISEFVQRAPVLDYMQAHECRPGRKHVISTHVYEGVDGGAWLFGRWQLFQAALGHEYDDLQWLVTEYGYAEGRGPVDCGAFLPDWDAARREYARYPEVIGFQAFAVGHDPTWTDVGTCFSN